MTANLLTLKQKRLKWVEANRENGFDEGINRLLTELYPDNAHFIYELLQNAEDPKATEVRFNLTDAAVEFEHNGERLFTLKDVESITSIGNSTKRDDATSIGKFGVGFKAVFAYTNTPEIHSGDFHFRIHDLVIPETNGVSKSSFSERKTSFIFPFDNPKKPSAIAVKEIETGLRNLGDNTLLFLSHIHKVEYKLPDGSRGSLQRFNHDSGRIEIRALHPGGDETVSHWLHFQKTVDVADDDGKPKTCNVAIAYSLVEEANKKTEEKTWKIVPLPHGQVSIYFPAEKETSNLRFHLHAPFASTVARDSVRDCKANHQLRDCVAELIVESLSAIRDQGLLTVNFLAVLPNPADNLAGNAPFYEPIRKAIVQAFKLDALTPMKRGCYYAAAENIFKGPASISEIIDDEDLVLLLNDNYEIPMWVSNPPQKNQREDRFLESLDIEEWGWSELVNSISSLDVDEERERIETWISEKDDAWLMRFYALLGEANEEYGEYVYASDIKIVRVNTDKGDEHVTPSEAFFPPDDEISPPDDIHFVKPEVYRIGRSKAQKESARSFLESIEVRAFDVKTIIQLKLERYENPPEQVDNWIYDEDFKRWTKTRLRRCRCEQVDASYYEDIKLFISYWKKNPLEQSLFLNKTILFGVSDENKPCWSKPEELCLDDPYLETGLAELVTIHEKKPVWAGYQEKLSKSQLKDFVDFLKATGVMTGLIVEKVSLYTNPSYRKLWEGLYNARETHTATRDDYSIKNLESFLNSQSIPCSRLIWHTLIKAESKAAKARFRPNATHPLREVDSQLVHHLKNHAWIPNKQDEFCKPQDMSRDELRNDFPYDDRNGLLSAIGFGENARRRSEEYQAKNKKAQQMGFKSAEQAAKWAELDKLGISPDELLAQQKHAEQPEESVPNPDRRRKGVLERGENAPSKESMIRERSIQPGIANVLAEAKAYLRAKYTNPHSVMVCQCRQNEMPFKVGDAYYFEAVQCVKEVKNHHIENRLALCPTCAAMYQHARKTEDSELRQHIVENNTPDNAPSVEISITLAEKEHQLRFVGTHWFDLKIILHNKVS
jgi:hypothetical protein